MQGCKEYIAIRQTLIADIHEILLSTRGGLLQECLVDVSLWKEVRYQLAKVSPNGQDWDRFNAFYSECAKWSKFVKSYTFDDGIAEKYNRIILQARRIDSVFAKLN